MALEQQIQKDIVEAMKAKDAVRLAEGKVISAIVKRLLA